ncbi:MAG TPA: AMP-dependent synthetase/ligase [Actinomycetota bacterium]|nr:AMP-dependent synthetase/ligase [Actinomycetota bacterium]
MARDVVAEQKDIDKTVEGQTVVGLFQNATKEFANVEALKWKVGDDWQSKTWAEFGEHVRDFAKGLVSLGLAPGEFVNLIGSNVPEYSISDFGVLHAGGTPVSLYNTLAPEQISYIVNHCDAKYVICENRDYFESFLKIQNEVPEVRKVILWRDAEEFADNDWVVSYESVLAEGRKQDDAELSSRMKAIDSSDLVTLIYTSGTTGPPKGVMVTHRNVCWTLESLLRAMPLEPGQRQISYLPMAHIAERMVGHYIPLRLGSTIHFCPNPRDVAAYLTAVRPTFFFAVPRIWEKLYQGLQNAINNNPDEGQKKAAQDALAATTEVVRLENEGKKVPDDVRKRAEDAKPVTDFIKQLVGLDQVVNAGTGAAPIAKEILEFFWALGVPIYEVYGQSEDTGPTSWNTPDSHRLGTVGPSLPGVETVLADDGELLVRGGNVTQGYYKEPELTAETFDSDGWLHSGDVAEFQDGFIKIVDRKKEILITAGGKNIAPSNVENMLKQHPLVGQACLIADQRPFATALIALDPDDAAAWAKQQGKPTDLASLSQDPDVVADIEAYIKEMNKRLHNQEQVKKFTVLPMEWSVDSGEVTPTLKMKRKVVNQKYEAEIESMYA